MHMHTYAYHLIGKLCGETSTKNMHTYFTRLCIQCDMQTTYAYNMISWYNNAYCMHTVWIHKTWPMHTNSAPATPQYCQRLATLTSCKHIRRIITLNKRILNFLQDIIFTSKIEYLTSKNENCMMKGKKYHRCIINKRNQGLRGGNNKIKKYCRFLPSIGKITQHCSKI